MLDLHKLVNVCTYIYVQDLVIIVVRAQVLQVYMCDVHVAKSQFLWILLHTMLVKLYGLAFIPEIEKHVLIIPV